MGATAEGPQGLDLGYDDDPLPGQLTLTGIDAELGIAGRPGWVYIGDTETTPAGRLYVAMPGTPEPGGCPCTEGRPQDCRPEDWPGAHGQPRA